MASVSQPDSIYTDIQVRRRQIRLLEIVSTSPSIDCRLEVTSLLDDDTAIRPKTYHALSYVWGDANNTEPILVNGGTISITTNLANALRRVPRIWEEIYPSRPQQECRLWADAVCIDQSNVDEKNHQVPLMKEIYTEAELVISWLGTGDATLFSAIDTINTMGPELERFDGDEEVSDDLSWLQTYPFLYESETPNKPTTKTWDALADLFSLPYWTRVWIFQELCLPRACIIVCGHKITSMGALMSMGSWLWRIQGRKVEDKPEFIGDIMWEFLTSVAQRAFAKLRMLQITRAALQFHASKSPETAAMAESLLWQSSLLGRGFQSTDSRDAFYGLLGISRIKLVVDYGETKSLAEVSCDYFTAYLSFRRQLEIGQIPTNELFAAEELYLLRFSGIGHGWTYVPGLPSWAPNFAGNEVGEVISSTGVFSNGDRRDLFPEMSADLHLVDSKLTIQGIVADRVTSVSPRLDIGILERDGPVSWMLDYVFGRDTHTNGWTPLLALFDTLYKQSATEETPPTWIGAVDVLEALRIRYGLRQAGLYSLSDEEFGGRVTASIRDRLQHEFFAGVQLNDIWELEEKIAHIASHGSPQQSVDEFLGNMDDGLRVAALPVVLALHDDDARCLGQLRFQMQLKSMPFRLAETAGGDLCLVPPGATEEDLICFLKGASQPSLFRKSESYYLHVGTCSVLGLEEKVRHAMEIGSLNIEPMEIR
ncbi:putative HET-domain-containing protein [Seiridium cardinale]